MSISLEALAMSGANFFEDGFDIEEWELKELEVPHHLLAEEEEEEEGYQETPIFLELQDSNSKNCYNSILEEDYENDHENNDIEKQSRKPYWSFVKKMILDRSLSYAIVILSTTVFFLTQKYRKSRSSCNIDCFRLIVYVLVIRMMYYFM
ncbi:uncharacterized protein LOC127242342 [Andrographis paniculata]|uniref:uncharacterized protein LOC127242342 n=1 Tax=Andrographis paniculata TaxID=175694 RepID=UPI0021E75826|nr:uncharacterized protein LOC127242342 [Andrographis paniculata]